MFGALSSLAKAAIGVAVNVPVAVVADAFTMCGAAVDRREPYTATAVKDVVKNVEKSVK